MIERIADARVVVTGSAGLIGRAAVALLREAGAEVVGFDRVPVPPAGVVGDLLDVDAVTAVVAGADAVVHLAGIPGPGIVDDIATYRINAAGSYAVFSLAAAAGVSKVVYASSINANGLPLGQLRGPSRLPYDEDEAPAWADSYSLSKQANEDAARMAAARWGLDMTGLRLPLVRDLAIDNGAAFAAHVREAIRRDPVRQAYEGWSYLDVSDAARAIAAALTRRTPPAPGILVAAPTTYLSIDTAEAARTVVPEVPLGQIRGREVGLDLTMATTLLGFSASVRLEHFGAELLAGAAT